MTIPRLLMRGAIMQQSFGSMHMRPYSVAFSSAKATTIVTRPLSSPFEQRRGMARGARSRKPQLASEVAKTKTPPPPTLAVKEEDAWTAVTDKETGGVYYWNEVTNATTAVGAPKPGSPEEQQLMAQQQGQVQQPAQGGLGRAVAEGFSFGVGAGIARAAVGSIFGGFGGGDDDDGSAGGGGGDGSDWV